MTDGLLYILAAYSQDIAVTLRLCKRKSLGPRVSVHFVRV